MTILRLDGFETLGNTSTSGSDVGARLDLRYDVDQSGGLSPTLVDDYESNGFALRFPNTGVGQDYRLEWVLPAALQVTQNASVGTFVFGARVKIPTSSAGKTLFHWMTGSGSSNMSLSVNDAGTDIILSSGSVTISSVVTPGEWHYIEWEFKPTSSANGGYQKVHVDGVEEYDSGPQSVSASFFAAYGLTLEGPQNLSGVGDNWVAYDDVVLTHLDGVDHTAALGPRRIFRTSVTADSSVMWSPSTGADNYAMIDELEFDDTDYVESSVDGDEDRYTLTDAPSGSVEAVQMELECFNTTGGTPVVYIGVHDGTEASVSETVDDTVNNTFIYGVFEERPSGGEWNSTWFSSAEALLKQDTV